MIIIYDKIEGPRKFPVSQFLREVMHSFRLRVDIKVTLTLFGGVGEGVWALGSMLESALESKKDMEIALRQLVLLADDEHEMIDELSAHTMRRRLVCQTPLSFSSRAETRWLNVKLQELSGMSRRCRTNGGGVG